MIKKHLVIVRTSGSILDLNSYNCQELGLAKALARKGCRVSLILAGHENTSYDVLVDESTVKVFYRKYKSLVQSLAWFDNIESLLNDLKPDLLQVHEFGMLMSWRVVRWAKMHGIPCYLIQGNYQTTQKMFFKQLELLYNNTFGKYVLKNVSRVGCKTLMAEKYVKKYEAKLCCCPTPIGLDVDAFKTFVSRNWKKELALEHKKILLYVGKIEPRRNPLFLVKILEKLPKDFVLLMAGDGPSVSEVFHYIEQNQLKNRCKLLGKLSQGELPSLYGCSDLFLLASDYEIYGMVILEAMYFGVPAISSRTAGSEMIIDNDMDGCIVSQKDVSSWIAAIKNVYDGSLLENMKKNATEKIRNKLIWDQACVSFMNLYGFNKE